MSKREELARRQAQADVALRRRLIFIGITSALVVAIFVGLQQSKKGGGAVVREQPPPQASLALPEMDEALLAQVQDAALADQVVLEPEPFAHVSQLALALLPSLLQRLDEPAFPFADGPARAPQLRGKPFRARGTLIQGELLARTESAPVEYWAVVRTEAGQEFVHVSVNQPEEPFAQGDFVLADGYFFKYYSTTIGEERRTLPLFIGRELLPSVRPVAPATRPDPVALAGVYDPRIDEDLPKDDDAMWHLMNVARTLQQDPPALDAAFAQAPWLDVALLKQLNDTPSAYRGAPVRIAGFLSLAEVWPVGENPLGLAEYSEAWLANSNFGDIRVMLRAPGRMDFSRMQGIHEFRGWFQQMWSYEAQDGHRFRIPLFVFADARPIGGGAASSANGTLTLVLVGLAAALGALLFFLVQRDRQRSIEAEVKLLERRRQRRGKEA